jgi:hypothetical protein
MPTTTAKVMTLRNESEIFRIDRNKSVPDPSGIIVVGYRSKFLDHKQDDG